MKTMRPIAFAIAFALTARLAGAETAAQAPQDLFVDQAIAAPAPGVPLEEQREEVRKKMQAVRIMRLTEALRLDEKTAARFIPALTALEQKQRELMRENQQIMADLRQELSAKASDQDRIKKAVDRMHQNHQTRVKLRDREFEAAKEHLTVEQQARFILFQHDFMREMRGMMAGARGQRRGPGNGPMMRGEPWPE